MEYEPSDRALRRKLLASLQAAGLHREAVSEAGELLRLQPESSVARYFQGAGLLELGRVDESIPLLEDAVRRSPGDRRMRSSLATAYLRAGRGGEAIPHLDAALRAGEDERLLFQLARAHQSAGNASEARAALERRRVVVSAKAATPFVDEITPP